jgi:hypothetical protein
LRHLLVQAGRGWFYWKSFYGYGGAKLMCNLTRGKTACYEFDRSEFVIDHDGGISFGLPQNKIADKH